MKKTVYLLINDLRKKEKIAHKKYLAAVKDLPEFKELEKIQCAIRLASEYRIKNEITL